MWDPEQFKCVETWEREECGVTTVPPSTTTRRNTCTRHTSCQEDGYWNEEDCGPDFCQCWRGWGWVKTCMEPLVFDETLPGCRSVLSRIKIVKFD